MATLTGAEALHGAPIIHPTRQTVAIWTKNRPNTPHVNTPEAVAWPTALVQRQKAQAYSLGAIAGAMFQFKPSADLDEIIEASKRRQKTKSSKRIPSQAHRSRNTLAFGLGEASPPTMHTFVI
jgi:hypothetical protein